MVKPTILAVDDDRGVLNSVERDLRQKYGRDYRIVKAESGAAALEVLVQLKQRGETVALFVVDQRMPQMSGIQFLEQAVQIFPYAQGAAYGLCRHRSRHWRHQQGRPRLLLDETMGSARGTFLSGA